MSPTIRCLQAEDAALYRPLRLRALTEDPAAYLTSADEFAARSLADIAGQLTPSKTAFTLGAFAGAELVGIATLARAERPKQRHRAEVMGVYMAPGARGQGAAASLLGELIRQARQLPGLDVLGLSVTDTQLAARTLYGKLGFTVWGVQPDALRQAGIPLTELHLQLTL
ncbi:GNAT family N-acetyltransferase [Deinococcus rubellus]|uniref:GNAT family N-acetyltransferase n=1 Tax=Deinococcus rubellus TaxID=1889240 RepID=A0ABY5YJJ4_9DEIO|nr:GNAT family N-acetyltransferase [Deinococcus rubellus]UWX65285.1 GNAT family N-acetyltransferase [Deinococcus rubellus]